MNASRDLIRSFLDAEEVVYTVEADGSFRFMTDLDRHCRIRSCATVLRCEEKRLLVSFELPLRVPRRECESVAWRISLINASLREYECFETDLLDGLVRFRLTADPPSAIQAVYVTDVHKMLYSMLEYCLDVVEKHVNEIVGMIFDDHAHRPSARPADIADIPEYDEDDYDLFEEFPDLKPKEGLLVRLLKFTGLLEDKE